MVKRRKHNRILFLFIVGGLVLVFFIGISLWGQVSDRKGLKEQHASLLSELNLIENEIAERQANLDVEKKVSVEEATGLAPSLVERDTQSAEAYFGPAFNWKSNADYEKARGDYIESLGEGNSFTEVYLPPDIKIDTNDGPLAYIDFEGLRATLGDIHIVPLTSEGDRIRYVAFVTYFMHKEEQDTVNLEVLDASEAIIEFTAAGDAEKGERQVTEVTASPGFRSSVESN